VSKSFATAGLQLALLLSLGSFSLTLGTGSPALAEAAESPESFLQRYLSAVQAAKSPMQLLEYMVPRERSPVPPAQTPEDKKMEAEMMALVIDMQHASTPHKVAIEDKQDNGDKVILKVKATELDPKAGVDLHAAGASVTGKIVLQKGPKGWLVANEFWHSDNGAGQVIDTGKDPDAAPVAASPIDKYTDDIMAALSKVWTDPAPGIGQVTVEMKNTTSGHFELLGIKDKAGNKEAEALVKSALSGIVLPPLPTEVAEQPIVNIQLSWSPRSKDTMKMVQLLHSSMLQ
jgi:hypothetical protein